MVKNPTANGGVGLIPRSRRSPGLGNGTPLQYSCLENSMDRGAWWASPWSHRELDTIEHTLTHSTICASSFDLEDYILCKMLKEEKEKEDLERWERIWNFLDSNYYLFSLHKRYWHWREKDGYIHVGQCNRRGSPEIDTHIDRELSLDKEARVNQWGKDIKKKKIKWCWNGASKMERSELLPLFRFIYKT